MAKQHYKSVSKHSHELIHCYKCQQKHSATTLIPRDRPYVFIPPFKNCPSKSKCIACIISTPAHNKNFPKIMGWKDLPFHFKDYIFNTIVSFQATDHHLVVTAANDWPSADLLRLAQLGYNPSPELKLLIIDIERTAGLFPNSSCLRRYMTPTTDTVPTAILPPTSCEPTQPSRKKLKVDMPNADVQALSTSAITSYRLSFDNNDKLQQNTLDRLRSHSDSCVFKNLGFLPLEPPSSDSEDVDLNEDNDLADAIKDSLTYNLPSSDVSSSSSSSSSSSQPPPTATFSSSSFLDNDVTIVDLTDL